MRQFEKNDDKQHKKRAPRVLLRSVTCTARPRRDVFQEEQGPACRYRMTPTSCISFRILPQPRRVSGALLKPARLLRYNLLFLPSSLIPWQTIQAPRVYSSDDACPSPASQADVVRHSLASRVLEHVRVRDRKRFVQSPCAMVNPVVRDPFEWVEDADLRGALDD